MRFLLSFLMLVASASAAAQSQVSLASEVLAERVVTQADGRAATRLEPPKVVTPGDKLLFVLTYSNKGLTPATDFVVTNPIPAAVAYSDAEGDALVSVDGGRTWGALAALKLAQPDGTSRAGLPADVTHVRWTFAQAIPAGQGGKLKFRGVVK